MAKSMSIGGIRVRTLETRAIYNESAPWVAITEDAWIFGESGSVLLKSGSVILEFGQRFEDRDNESYLFEGRKVNVSDTRIDALVAIIGSQASGYNYYHFMIDWLPRLLLLHRYCNESWKDIEFFVTSPMSLQVFYDIVGALGLGKKVQCILSDEAIFCSRLIIPSRPGWPTLPTHWGISLIRDCFGNTYGDTNVNEDWSYIYVSRAGCEERNVENESILCAELQKLGFMVVDGRQLTFFEQISIFSKARCVVGPHGAGLTNIIFMSQGGSVVEICDPCKPFGFYRNLAHVCNVRHYYYGCDIHKQLGKTFFKLDIEDFVEKIKEMLQE